MSGVRHAQHGHIRWFEQDGATHNSHYFYIIQDTENFVSGSEDIFAQYDNGYTGTKVNSLTEFNGT